MPVVTVILTSYNHEKYIGEAIQSVLNQTFADFELVILDDCSADGSWGLISQYNDPRIKAHRNDVVMGPVLMVNKAISELASGEYIAIHHSDDAWELDKLEKQVAFLDANHEVGATFTWVQVIDEHGNKLIGNWFDQENTSQWQKLNLLFNEQNNLNHPSVLIRKKCYQEIGAYRPYLAQTPDAEMWSRLLIKYPIHIIQEKLTKHRLFSNLSNTSGNRLDVAIRSSNEWNALRENFLELTDFEEIVAVFPSLERFRNQAGFDHKFLLAMACLYECKQRNAWQLGLKWLRDLISDITNAQRIKELYAFSYNDFIALTAQFDVYFVEEDRKLYEQAKVIDEQAKVIDEQAKVIDEQAKVIDEQAKVIDEQAKVIDEIYASMSWQLTRPLRFLNKYIENLK